MPLSGVRHDRAHAQLAFPPGGHGLRPGRWSRPWAHCPTCRHGWSPTDRTLGLAPHQRLSGPLRAWLVREGGATAFAEAADLLEDLTGLAVSPETVRTQTEAAGAALDQAQQADRATVERTRAPAGTVDAAPHQLVAETDGVLVRFNDGWHEVKLGVVGGWDPAAPPERQRLEAPSYVAAREPVGLFAGRWGAEVARRGGLDILGVDGPATGLGLARLRAVVVLGDGARWIWTAAAEQFGERLEIVDWYHASEHVWTVARAVFGAGTAAAEDWVAVSLAGLWSAGAATVLARLRELVPPTDEARWVVATERGYFQSNRQRMRYPEFRAQGLPIGSGAVESAAKHLVQQRMQRPAVAGPAPEANRWPYSGPTTPRSMPGPLTSLCTTTVLAALERGWKPTSVVRTIRRPPHSRIINLLS